MANHLESPHCPDGQWPTTRNMASKGPAVSKTQLLPNIRRPKTRSMASKGPAGGKSRHFLDTKRPKTRSMASKGPACSKTRLLLNTKRPQTKSMASKGPAAQRPLLDTKGPKTRNMVSKGPAASESRLPLDKEWPKTRNISPKDPAGSESRRLDTKGTKTRSMTSKGPAGNRRPPVRPNLNVVVRSRGDITGDLLLMPEGSRKRGSQEVSERPVQVTKESHAPSAKRGKVNAEASSSNKSGFAAGPITRSTSQSIVKTKVEKAVESKDTADSKSFPARPEEEDASKTQPRRSSREIQPQSSSQPATAPQPPKPRVRVSRHQGAATGHLIQYVVDMIDDSEPMYDPKFQTQTKANIARGDYRYMTPCGTETDERDRAMVNRALEITRIDFFQRKGEVVPEDLKVQYHNESYASQHRRIQEIFDRKWGGLWPAPKLYRLPKWTGAFKNWGVPVGDDRGKELQRLMEKWEHNERRMGLIPAYWK